MRHHGLHGGGRRVAVCVAVATFALFACSKNKQQGGATSSPAASPPAARGGPRAEQNRETTPAGDTKMAIQPSLIPQGKGDLYAIFQTSAGSVTCRLFEKEAPETVANFVGLAMGTKEWTDPQSGQKVKKPLYDGTVFHRVIPNFMIQGGDPLGTGTGDPGYRFKDEFQSGRTFDKPGLLAMANAGPNTNGSQFFITEVPTPHLNNKHTIFGECIQGFELVPKIARGGNSKTTLQHVEIVRAEKAP
jgi:peptidyl-prolyl cis-trans isomerase A (cyclophilin A)